MTLHTGDCLDVMATFDAESIDAIVTDPPYGLGFMGKAWDADFAPGDSAMRRRPEMDAVNTGASRQGGRQRYGDGYQKRQARDAREFQAWCETWADAAFRVAKPGAHLLAFGGTRTYHRLAAAIEDAGWEIRDTLVWAYASGFPKSRNLDGEWQGWGTALKPAWEPIVMARKPLRGTVAGNVLAHGTGAINVDGCRIGLPEDKRAAGSRSYQRSEPGGRGQAEYQLAPHDGLGRWPANVLLTDPIFDGDVPGVVGGGEAGAAGQVKRQTAVSGFGGGGGELDFPFYGDSGTYSRFFLIPKAARSDREPVLGGLPLQAAGVMQDDAYQWEHDGKGNVTTQRAQRANHHPTVKPTELMRHLVRLVTPPGGLVLDPFLGSGTTALACEAEGFQWVGIEREPEYVAIAEARLNGTQRGLGLSFLPDSAAFAAAIDDDVA